MHGPDVRDRASWTRRRHFRGLSNIAQKVTLIAWDAGSRTNTLVNQFGHKQAIVQAAQTLQHSAVPVASRAGHCASQKTGLFGGNPKVESMTASWVFTGRSVNDAWASKIFVSSLHWSASFREQLKVPVCSFGPCLDVGHVEKFQATRVPPGRMAFSMDFTKDLLDGSTRTNGVASEVCAIFMKIAALGAKNMMQNRYRSYRRRSCRGTIGSGSMLFAKRRLPG